jgi:16S rRNA (guanine527-N7)-methyltransferase
LPEWIVSRETIHRLTLFASLVEKWSRHINLVSKGDISTLWPRHIDDSLQIAPLVCSDDAPGIDLGSGAGFPGLVLAIATGRPFHLIEADQRKCAFLREAARAVSAPVFVHATRIESSDLTSAKLITARGLAPLVQLLELASPMLDPEGVCIFLKGRSVEGELTQAMRQWHMKVRLWRSRTDPEARILHVSEIKRARYVGADSSG